LSRGTDFGNGEHGGRGGALIYLAAYTLLTVAWIFSNPVFAAPDEWSHVVRAESIAFGQLIGTPAGKNVLRPDKPGVSAATIAQQNRWAAQNTRRVSIPAGKTPQWFGCSADPFVPALCLQDDTGSPPAGAYEIPSGNYQPFPYLLPALVARASASPNTIALGMRLVRSLLALALLAAAILVLWVPGSRGLPMLGLVVATTPMVVFLAAAVNPSGLEIAAGIAFFAALLRLRRPDPPNARVWALVGVTGAILALSRSQSPLWVVLDIGIFLALVGLRPAYELVKYGGRSGWGALSAIVAAIVLNRIWEGLYGPKLPIDITPVGLALKSGWFELPGVLRQEIGVFDYLEVSMSPLAYVAWYGLVAALLALALLVATRRERLVLLAASFAALALPVMLVGAFMRHTGYGLQGRYVLAFSVAIPLLAGEIVFRRREVFSALDARWIVVPFAVVAAIVQFDGLYANARRFAVGVAGPQWFLGAPVSWAPPGGWWLWLLIMIAGAVLLAFSAPLEVVASSRAGRALRDAGPRRSVAPKQYRPVPEEPPRPSREAP
jgi:hypothetical protein